MTIAHPEAGKHLMTLVQMTSDLKTGAPDPSQAPPAVNTDTEMDAWCVQKQGLVHAWLRYNELVLSQWLMLRAPLGQEVYWWYWDRSCTG